MILLERLLKSSQHIWNNLKHTNNIIASFCPEFFPNHQFWQAFCLLNLFEFEQKKIWNDITN